MISGGEVWASGEYHKPYTSARALGFGGGTTGTADGEDALFYNPASLAFNKSSLINPIHMQLTFGKNDYDLIFTDFDKIEGLKKTMDFVRKYLGDNIHYGQRLLMHYIRPSFGIGWVVDALTVNTKIKTAGIFPAAQFEVVLYDGFFLSNGFKIKVKKGELGLGWTVKYLAKAMAGIKISAFDFVQMGDMEKTLEEKKKELLRLGAAPGVDIGGVYKLKYPYFKASYGVLLENIFHVRYESSKYLRTAVKDAELLQSPPWDKFRMAAGVMLESIKWHYMRGKFYFDLRNMFAPGTKYKKVHFGTEITFEEPLFGYQPIMLRLGYNQGNLCYGFGLDFWTLQFDFAKYAEEIGDKGQITGIEGDSDTRYLFSLQMGF